MKKIESKRVRLFCAIIIFLFYVDLSFALVISEIYPKPVSPQTDKEWVEIFNDYTDTIDLTEYVLYENDGNRKITAVTDKMLLSGEYAVLVQNEIEFRKLFPNYTGKIFKSSFASLTDSGEVLTLKKGSSPGTIVYTIDYKPFAGGIIAGQSIIYDGTTYPKKDSTPGSGDLQVGSTSSGTITDQNNDQNATGTTSTTASSTTQTEVFSQPLYYYRSYWPESEKIYLDVGSNKVGMAGVPIFFEVKAVTGEKKQVANGNYFWSFGDGESSEGKSAVHTFKYIGEYVVDVEGYANGYRNNQSIFVKIIEPDLKISLKNVKEERLVEIQNNSKDLVDVGGLLVKSMGGEFEYTSTLVKNLRILPNKNVSLSQSVLKFATSTTRVSLNFPNGNSLSEFVLDPGKLKNENPVPQVVQKIGSTTVQVMTKEDFERRLSEVSPSVKVLSKKEQFQENSKNLQMKKQEIVLDANKLVTDKKIDSQESSRFVVGGEEKGIFHNLLKYFGM